MTQRIREVRIESAQNIPMGSEEVQAITVLIEGVDAAVPLTEVTLVALAPLQYRYRLVFADGRTWTQIITQANATDINPLMTFAVPAPGLKLSEFASQRELRAAIVALIASHGLSELAYEFN